MGFDRIQALRDAVDALYTSDEAKRRFEIMARQVFIRFKALLMEPSAFAYVYRHDNIEAIYKKLEEKRERPMSPRCSRNCTRSSTRPYAPRSPAKITPRASLWT